jgi:CheY-like chemotaxis protein
MTKKILVVDDDIDLVEVIRLTLEKSGFEVIDAQDGEHGYNIAAKEKPDLIILDIMMTTIDEGFHVAYKIRSNPEIADVPIIVLTAVGQETGFEFDKDKDEEFLPVDDFLEKPVLPEKLVDIIRKHLGM